MLTSIHKACCICIHYLQCNSATNRSIRDLDVMLVAAYVGSNFYPQAEKKSRLKRSGKLISFYLHTLHRFFSLSNLYSAALADTD
uniref:Uncharacterized protein n=1 Tax=Monopterus albus TaxID=43700 RepID=A0A3Q3R339_MONAL